MKKGKQLIKQEELLFFGIKLTIQQTLKNDLKAHLFNQSS
jgi:hypothetical protein